MTLEIISFKRKYIKKYFTPLWCVYLMSNCHHVFNYLEIAQYYLVFHIVVKSLLKLAVVRFSFIAHPNLYETKSLSSLFLMITDVWKISKNYIWLHVRRISEECSAGAAGGKKKKLVPKMNACTLHYCKPTAA